MRNAGLDEEQAGIKIAGRNINNLNMQMIPPLWQKAKTKQKKTKIKEPLDQSERGVKKLA